MCVAAFLRMFVEHADVFGCIVSCTIQFDAQYLRCVFLPAFYSASFYIGPRPQEVMMHNAQKEIVEKIVEIEVVKVRTTLLCAALCSCTVRSVCCLLLHFYVYTHECNILLYHTHMRTFLFFFITSYLASLLFLCAPLRRCAWASARRRWLRWSKGLRRRRKAS